MDTKFLIFMALFFILSIIIIITHVQLYIMVKKNFFSHKKSPSEAQIKNTSISTEIEDLKKRVAELEKKVL